MSRFTDDDRADAFREANGGWGFKFNAAKAIADAKARALMEAHLRSPMCPEREGQFCISCPGCHVAGYVRCVPWFAGVR